MGGEKESVCEREREREREEKAVQFLPVEIVGVKKLELCLALFSRLRSVRSCK